MKRVLLFIGLVVGLVSISLAQNDIKMRELKAQPPVCIASGKVENVYIPPPNEFLLKSAAPKSDIIVEYSPLFPAEAKTAFEFAVGIWESLVESKIPIHVYANWSSTLGTNTLASCAPETYYSNFKDAPFKNIFYPVAIAEKITGEELNGIARNDIEADFNSKIKWYYGTDGATPDDSYDFATVALHELAHGLGFTGFFFIQGDLGAYAYYEFGDASSFDRMVEQSLDKSLVDTSFYENASSLLKKALESNGLYENSPVARSLNEGHRPRLYAPSTFDDGSSVYHLNDLTYSNGNENALMTHAIGMAEAIYDPGPLTKGIMEDIGWTNLFLRFSPIKDMEETGPVNFIASVESYYPIDTASLMVVYSTDSFQVKADTLQLLFAGQDGIFSATLVPEPGVTDIQYYVTATDEKGRVRASPSTAPAEIHTIHFGPDNKKPVITHHPIPYFLLLGNPLVLEAEVNDNLGVDTVYVSYAINNFAQPSFGLNPVSGNTYAGMFNFDLNALNDGDIISYSIIARDASTNQNTVIYPSDEAFQFKVERIFGPVTTYTNDFNQADSDFIISDFSIYTADSFQNGALHSPHPYLSPNQDNKELNFSTFLKYPVVLQADGDMTYDEVVLVEPGESGAKYGDDNFWDYVIVEGSKDFGETWYELTDGYDSGSNSIWKQNYNANIVDQVSQAVGTSEWYASHTFNLLEKGNFAVGDTILIRFRLYSDPYASGWGWAIDNLSIQKPAASPVISLSQGRISIYPNPFQTHFNVEIGNGKLLGEVRIDVYDSFGRNIYSLIRSNATSLKESIDMQKYSSGLYLVKVSENGVPVLSRKMIRN